MIFIVMIMIIVKMIIIFKHYDIKLDAQQWCEDNPDRAIWNGKVRQYYGTPSLQQSDMSTITNQIQ